MAGARHRQAVVLVGLAALFAAAAGCTTTELVVPEGLIHPECAAESRIELVVLDVWGRTVTQPTVVGFSSGQRTLLVEDETMTWTVGVDGFVTTDVTAVWDGGEGAGALTASATDGAAVAVSLDVLNVEGRGCRVYTLFVGVDHPWYASSGRAPRAGNDVRLLMDGEEYWAAVYEDLANPKGDAIRVHQTTWWWMSDFELIRPEGHEQMSPGERWPNTMLSLLEQRGGYNRLLVARFAENTAPGMAYLNTDPLLRERGTDPDDEFEVMLQGNPVAAPLQAPYEAPEVPFSFVARVRGNPMHEWRHFHEPVATLEAPLATLEAASYHQKALIVDDYVAYVSGMNVKSTDWDTNDHRLFDSRRMRFQATQAEREAVQKREALPDLGPRKDYGIRVEGPAARDLDDILRVRWEHGLSTGAMFEGDSTPYELLEPAPIAGDVTAQIVTTMPDPVQERSILETLIKASANATDFIYIEDQYFRAPILHDAIDLAMEAHPDLHLVVVTKPVAFTDQAYRDAFPDRYLLLQLFNFDREGETVYFQGMDTHSKLLIVDDVYLSVGSANKNNRGLLYEGELNVAVHDPAFVKPARDRVLANLVSDEKADEVMGRTGREIHDALKALAESNAAIEELLLEDPDAEATPTGFVYPLEIEPGWLLEVGPDVF